MAAKRVSTTAMEWGTIAARVHPEQRGAIGALKAKVDKHMRVVNSLPASLPKIDFDMYKARVAVPGMVDNFQNSYGALNIPYPTDKGTIAEIDAEAKENESTYIAFCKESNERIATSKVELARFEAMKNPVDMTLEEALDAGLTDYVVDPNGGTAWPHDQTWEEFNEKVKNSNPEDWH